MKQDPLITYGSLVPGILLYAPGRLGLPLRERIRREVAPAEAPRPRSTLAIGPADGAWTRLWKTYTALFSLG